MASWGVLIFVIPCFLSPAASSFVELVCEHRNTGQVNHQSMLTCVVRAKQEPGDYKITVVAWKKKGSLIAVYDKEKGQKKEDEKYKFADHAFRESRNVSLLISNTKVVDEDDYSCTVVTDIGFDTKEATLKVTAKYDPPTVSSIGPNANKPEALVCKTSGGYPQGFLRWFDRNKTEWTKSAKQTPNRTESGLFELSSELPLLEGSFFPEYTCVVYNSSWGKEGSATTTLAQEGSPEKVTGASHSAIIAPVVVIGSLIVGLLMALLFFRRRSQKNRRPSTTPLMGTHHQVPS